MEKRFLELKNVSAYQISFDLSNYVWKEVVTWDYFARDTVGKQWARSIDSMSANIAEGFGRYTKKDKIKYFRICFGSLKESTDWLEKAYRRGLISTDQYNHIKTELDRLPREIHYLIKYINEKLRY